MVCWFAVACKSCVLGTSFYGCIKANSVGRCVTCICLGPLVFVSHGSFLSEDNVIWLSTCVFNLTFHPVRAE